jgi:hypothetical protein
MTRCNAITKSGETCKGVPKAGNEYCPAHDPARDEERQRHGSMGGKRAGRGRPQPPQLELEGVKETLYRLAADIESGKLDTRAGAVLVQIFNAIRGAIEDQRKVRELEEVMERVAALENRQNGGARRWG